MTTGPNDIRIFPDVLRSIDSATFTGSYQAVGSALTQSTRIVKFTNNSTSAVTLSWNGTVDHEFLPANTFVLLDVSANQELQRIYEIQIGTTFYVKGSAGTGSFYISTYYAD